MDKRLHHQSTLAAASCLLMATTLMSRLLLMTKDGSVRIKELLSHDPEGQRARETNVVDIVDIVVFRQHGNERLAIILLSMLGTSNLKIVGQFL